MEFVEIYEHDKLKECIELSFEGDSELVDKYHIIGQSLYDCVNDTFNKILEASTAMDLEWYVVKGGNENIGFLVCSQALKLLYSFGLAISVRDKYSGELFQRIKGLLGDDFMCVLWTKNTRGIKYLTKNGMKVISKDKLVTTLCL